MASEDEYRGEHILPRRWWDGLPTFAKAVWIKAYREAERRDVEDPAMAAWDRVRKEYVWWHKEGWLRKDSLTAYGESPDRTKCLWLAQDWDWAGGMRPIGDLALPGNRYISKEEAANFTGEVRRVYEEHYQRMSNSIDDPHEIACRRVRAEFRETEQGWEKREAQTEEERKRRLKEGIDVEIPMFEDFGHEGPAEKEQMVRGEYPFLPEFLKEIYREGYKEGLREQHRTPIWRGWQAVISDYYNDGGTWKMRSQKEREMLQGVRKGSKAKDTSDR